MCKYLSTFLLPSCRSAEITENGEPEIQTIKGEVEIGEKKEEVEGEEKIETTITKEGEEEGQKEGGETDTPEKKNEKMKTEKIDGRGGGEETTRSKEDKQVDEEEEEEGEEEEEEEDEDVFGALSAFGGEVFSTLGTAADPLSTEERSPRPLSLNGSDLNTTMRLLQVI